MKAKTCEEARYDAAFCGHEGLWFVQKKYSDGALVPAKMVRGKLVPISADDL